MRNTIDSTDGSSTSGLGGNVRTSRRGFLRGAAGAGLVVAGGGLFGGTAVAADGAPPALQRDGNQIVTADGEDVELHGVNIADPKRVDVTAPVRGKNAVQAIDLATDASSGWHANVIRLPVQPVDIGEHEPGSGPEPVAFDEAQLETYLDNHLDPAIERCAQNGAYAIIDYHRHRDIPWNDETLSEEVTMFWDVVAERYGEDPHVIFEVFNEPQGNPSWGVSGQALVDYWHSWKDAAQPWVDTIRSHSDNLTLVGSPRWTQLTFGAVIEEFDGGNIGYTLHLYPGHGPTTPSDYDDFVTPLNYSGGDVPYDDETPAWEVAPVFMTEWGFDLDAGNPVTVSKEKTEGVSWAEYDPNYGEHVTEWLQTRPVHSTAWCFDVFWTSRMFERGFDVPDDAEWAPYDGTSMPELAPEQPAEWDLLQGKGYMGDTIKNFLGIRASLDGTAGDLDGDGLIEDLNADGSTDISDVKALFDRRDSPEVQSNAASFDHDGDGDVDVGDVITLLREIV